jgi:2-methylcitrate dehydratase PrpD
LQIGFAARGAVTAIELVKNGLTGPHDILEGPFGYFNLFEAASDLARYFDTIGTRWLSDDISIKPFPTGRAAHAMLGALQQLQATHKFCGDDIQRIDAHLTPLAYRLVGRPFMPTMTAAYARLCLPLLCALMLRDQKIDPQLFQASTFSDAHIQLLAAKINMHADLNPDPNALSPQSIIVSMSDGSQLRVDIPHTLGSPVNPLSDAQLRDKMNLCCALAASPLSDATRKLLIDTPLRFALAG